MEDCKVATCMFAQESGDSDKEREAWRSLTSEFGYEKNDCNPINCVVNSERWMEEYLQAIETNEEIVGQLTKGLVTQAASVTDHDRLASFEARVL